MENLKKTTAAKNQWIKPGLTGEQNNYQVARRRMVTEQLLPNKITDEQVIRAMSQVPRHMFVDAGCKDLAYLDRPVAIGEGQTISQPFIVAWMTQSLELTGKEKVLEIGTGCGYQTAILLELAREVYSIERHRKLSNQARRALYSIGYDGFKLRIGDGTLGWPEASPFDRIIVTAGSPCVPQALVDQLADGGILIIPVGSEDEQHLKIVTKNGKQIKEEQSSLCRFVKLIGEHGWQ